MNPTDEPTRPRAGVDIYLDFAPVDAPTANAVFQFLRRANLTVWMPAPTRALRLVADSERVISMASRHVVLLTAKTPPRWQRATFDFSARACARSTRIETLPIVREGYDPGEDSTWLDRLKPSLIHEATLEADMKALVARLSAPAIPTRLDHERTQPYLGLKTYGLNDARYFFGRTRALAEATARLGSTEDGAASDRADVRRWLRVEGPPGVGKASFARAAVVPAILRGAIRHGPLDWRVAALRPYGDPIRALSDALTLAMDGLLSPEEVRAGLDSDGGLADLVREHLPDEQGLLLVIDHLGDLAVEPSLDQAAVARFDHLLTEALDDFDQRLYLVTTSRSDRGRALGRLLPGLTRLAQDHGTVMELGGVDRDGLGAIIDGPAHMAGRPWPAPLARRLRDDAERTATAPSRLSWMLRALLDDAAPPTIARYEALGGIADGLDAACERTYLYLTEDEQRRAQRLLIALVGGGHGRADHLHGLSYDEAVFTTGDGPRAEALIAQLSGHSTGHQPLLALADTAQDGDTVTLVRLSHTAILRHWRRLGGWLDTHRPLLDRRAQVETSAQSWCATGEPDDALPSVAALSVFAGRDLPDPQRAQLLASLSSDARRLIECAEQKHAATTARSLSDTAAIQVASERTHTAALRSLRLRGRVLFLLVMLFVGTTVFGVMRTLEAEQAGVALEAQLVHMAHRHQRLRIDAREAEARHLKAEQERLDAERNKRAEAKARHISDQQGVLAEQSADDVLDFSIALTQEADAYFRRIPGKDALYARRMYAQAVIKRLTTHMGERRDNERLHFLLARQHMLVGDLEVDRGRLRGVAAPYEAAERILDQLTAQQPKNPQYLFALAENCERLGVFLARTRRTDTYTDRPRAIKYFRRAMTTRTLLESQLKGEDPTRAQLEALATVSARLGAALLKEGDLSEAQIVLDAALKRTSGLVERWPNDDTLKITRARRLGIMAQVAQALGNHADAAERLKTARAQLSALSVEGELLTARDRLDARLRRQRKALPTPKTP